MKLDLFGREVKNTPQLRDKFGVPPLTVFNTSFGYWRRRKQKWVALGIHGEFGRAGFGTIGKSALPDATLGKDGKTRRSRSYQAEDYEKQSQALERLNKFIDKKNEGVCLPGGFDKKYGRKPLPTTSVFDPVLCELIYRWYTPPEGHILDPFSGEVTKGAVAAHLGFDYTGIELRQEQVDINYKQAKKMSISPNWICGDSSKIHKLLPKGQKYDLIFTSPPYYDLEVYSKDSSDGSTKQTYEEFMQWYIDIFVKAVKFLKDDRFLVVKVGEVRDKKTGAYYNFVGDNIKCFQKDCGLSYYNEAILITALGSAPLRAGGQFSSGRKLCKIHQNILVFFKGDPRDVKEKFKELPLDAFGDVR